MTQDPHDQLLLQIRGAVAEYERTLITERMRRGRLGQFRAGILLPWTRPPYGYRLHPERPRDPQGVRTEPAEAAIVAEIYAHYFQDGLGLIKVAKYLAPRASPPRRVRNAGDWRLCVAFSPIRPTLAVSMRAEHARVRPKHAVRPPMR